MIKTVDTYIGKTAILGILLIWVSLTALMMMFSVLGELRATTASYGAMDVFWFVLQTGPRMAYQIFPVSALMGSLLGIGSLASANELVAFRVSGVSRLRLAVAGMVGTLLITLPVMAIGEFVAPDAEQQARAYRLSQLVGQVIIGGSSGMWIRDGSDIVNIRRPLLTADRGSNRSVSRKWKFTILMVFPDCRKSPAPTVHSLMVTNGRSRVFRSSRLETTGVVPTKLERRPVGVRGQTRVTRIGRNPSILSVHQRLVGPDEISEKAMAWMTGFINPRSGKRSPTRLRSLRWCSPACPLCLDLPGSTITVSDCLSA